MAYLGSLSKTDLATRQQDVLLNRFGGTRAKTAVEPGGKPGTGKRKPPTHIATLEMLRKKMSLREIADERGLTLGTILAHVEKLKGANQLPDIEYLMASLSADDFDAILDAFRKSGDGKLTPVHREFGGKYSFEDLRLVRLFAW